MYRDAPWKGREAVWTASWSHRCLLHMAAPNPGECTERTRRACLRQYTPQQGWDGAQAAWAHTLGPRKSGQPAGSRYTCRYHENSTSLSSAYLKVRIILSPPMCVWARQRFGGGNCAKAHRLSVRFIALGLARTLVPVTSCTDHACVYTEYQGFGDRNGCHDTSKSGARRSGKTHWAH
jgi:hypothetical protein